MAVTGSYNPISSYGIIGDMRSAALVGMEGGHTLGHHLGVLVLGDHHDHAAHLQGTLRVRQHGAPDEVGVAVGEEDAGMHGQTVRECVSA